MILVDASVWIDFLSSQRSTHQAHLSELIRTPGIIGTPGPVLQEVLQGIRDESLFRRVRDRLCQFPIILPDVASYLMAATLSRHLARRGMVIPPGDVAIASLAIQHDHELYTLDRRHFGRIQTCSTLRLHQLGSTHPAS